MQRDDERLAQLARAIRRERRLTQAQLALDARVPLNDIKRLEAGRAGELRLSRIRRVLESHGGRARLVSWWNGAQADRLLDEHHAQLVEHVVAVLRTRSWEVAVEVSFSEWGERGSIDILAWHLASHAVPVCEVKTTFGSLEETNRTLDAKVRLAPAITHRRLGWRPTIVGRLLIVPATRTMRRAVQRHAATMDAIYPDRSREVRAWLRHPIGDLNAIWFVSDGPNASRVHR